MVAATAGGTPTAAREEDGGTNILVLFFLLIIFLSFNKIKKEKVYLATVIPKPQNKTPIFLPFLKFI